MIFLFNKGELKLGFLRIIACFQGFSWICGYRVIGQENTYFVSVFISVAADIYKNVGESFDDLSLSEICRTSIRNLDIAWTSCGAV